MTCQATRTEGSTNSMTTDPGPETGAERTHDSNTTDAPTGSPGALRSETWLTLQTRQAQRLVHGRAARNGQPAIVGLTRFSTLVRQVWTGARAGDPYGDWWLLKIHDTLEASRNEIDVAHQTVTARLASVSGVDVTVACSLKPVRLPLSFSHAYAFRGAYLLASFDEIVRALLTARHVGLMSRDESERHMAAAARAVRRAFNSPTGYRFVGVTREDIRQATAKAQQASAIMGFIPDAILAGELGAPYGPRSQGGFADVNAYDRARRLRAREDDSDSQDLCDTPPVHP